MEYESVWNNGTAFLSDSSSNAHTPPHPRPLTHRPCSFTVCEFEGLMTRMDWELSFYNVTLQDLLSAGESGKEGGK